MKRLPTTRSPNLITKLTRSVSEGERSEDDSMIGEAFALADTSGSENGVPRQSLVGVNHRRPTRKYSSRSRISASVVKRRADVTVAML